MPKYHVLYQQIVSKYIETEAESAEEAAALAIKDKGVWLRIPETTGHRVIKVLDSSTDQLTGNDFYHTILESN